jgi:hypothetical protein
VKLYIAGLYSSTFTKTGRIYQALSETEKHFRDSVEFYLESYHYVHKDTYVRRIREDGARVFLDSGAFSAFTQGVEIDIGAYCDYIHANGDIIEVASVLDAIGDPEGTWRNQCEMERRGVKPLPCFHYGEPESLLEHYIANYDYITLGGMVPISTPQLKLWLDRLFERHICDANGVPRTKVHGFGLTSLPLMERYPWYSVDSSTWIQWASRGMILLPGVGQLHISADSSYRKVEGQHFDTLSKLEQERLSAIIESFGTSAERLATTYPPRWGFNVWAFPYWMRHKVWGEDRFTLKQPELF